jgi:sigma-B regulation protein RsbU (phosphoserine phosphatase)
MKQEDYFRTPGDRLALLYQLSQTFNSSLDLDEVLNRVMDEVIQITRAERGFVMLNDAESKLVFKAARGMDQRTIENPDFQISRSIVEKVALEHQPILTSDAQADARFNIRKSVILLGLRSIICVPLMLRDRCLGVIYVDSRLQAGIFSPADLELLHSIAFSAATAIENARLYQVAVEKGRIERELQMARKVQNSLLPRQIPLINGWDFDIRWKPAREVSGDYYDFIDLKEGKLGIVIADVTDKGMPAALFMASTRSFVRASANASLSPAEGIIHSNRLICGESEDGLFVTLFYALIDLQSGEFTYVNAGHNPPLFYHSANGQLSILATTGIPLGIDPEHVYTQQTITLRSGDFVLLYTDGVSEATNPLGEEFGMDRLKASVLSTPMSNCKEIIKVLEESLHSFIAPSGAFDDLTILIAKKITESTTSNLSL